MTGFSTFNVNPKITADATGTYTDDGCGIKTSDGEPCNCTNKIVILRSDC
ncbi:hypothetical protein QYS49_33540 [Marivirga salinae]|uniref:Uncharacterized protein n=1 Tax=Marivirga salinarum TaxID=3059078 RepID=A0AA51NC59_9BACT|nr:hypothetical protein [Marivirga sp. BDSF4-3]WMN12428.1 hypothetical protein QYS49_33540 [Marivirga sp. BDSF4-3]